MPKNMNWSSRKTVCDSIFSFSNLDSVWPNYKNSPIFIEGQNKKFKFVFQCNLMISVDQLCSIFISSMVGMLAVEVDAFCHKSYKPQPICFSSLSVGSSFTSSMFKGSVVLQLTFREQFQCPVKYCSVLILKRKQTDWTLNWHTIVCWSQLSCFSQMFFLNFAVW